MEHGLQVSLKRYALSVEIKMAAGAFVRARNYGREVPDGSNLDQEYLEKPQQVFVVLGLL